MTANVRPRTVDASRSAGLVVARPPERHHLWRSQAQRYDDYGDVHQTPHQTLTSAVVAGRYSLEREIARGGMGTVWLAHDQRLGRRVAIKVIVQELAGGGEASRRFAREAQALAQLRSTHVVQVYDYGVHEEQPYIVMELLDGESLGQRLKRTGRLDVEEVAGLLEQICKGLKAAHNAGLLHRDLKPSNIFIARCDDVEVVKLLDFGLVKALDSSGESEATTSGMLLGTPQYMSPEQARGTAEADLRSDLWSVAVIAFRMLTGQNPFSGESVGDVVLKICSDALPRISDYRHALPPALDEYFKKAFQRQPDARFQSANEMAAELTRILDEAVAAGPDDRRSHPGGGPASLQMTGGVVPLGEFSSQPLPPPATPSGARLAPANARALSMPGLSTEPTPVSTTVGGTQVAPKIPAPVVFRGSQPFALVVGAVATLSTVALGAAVWVGFGDATQQDTPSTAAQPSSVASTPALDDDSTAREEGGGGDDDVGEALKAMTGDGDVGSTDVGDDSQGDGVEPGADAGADPAPRGDLTAKPATTTPKPGNSKQKQKTGKHRPDWGLGGR